MDYVISDISARQFWDTPVPLRDLDLTRFPGLLGGIPSWMLGTRSNARGADALVQGRLLGDLKGLTLPIHIMIPEGASRHVSRLVVPHRMPTWLKPEHVVSLGHGLGVLSPEVAFLLDREGRGIWKVALDLYRACGIYAVHKPTMLSDLAIRAARERGILTEHVDLNAIIYGYSDARGRPLGAFDAHGDELPWTPCLDRSGRMTDMWKRYPITSVEALAMTASELAGVRGVALARKALPVVMNGSASPVESRACLMLCSGARFGGEAFGRPDLNRRIDYDATARAIAHRTYCYGDMVWPDKRIVLEVQGESNHADDQGFYVQTGRAPALKVMGYRMLEITHEQMADLDIFDAIVSGLADDLGFALRERTPAFLRRRDELHRGLFGA